MLTQLSVFRVKPITICLCWLFFFENNLLDVNVSYNHVDDGHGGGDAPRVSVDGAIVPLDPVRSKITEGNKEARLLSE